MSRKSIMLALAAAVSFGAIALSSNDASAFGRSFGGFGATRVGDVHLAGPLHVNYAHPIAYSHPISPIFKKPQVVPVKLFPPILPHPHHHRWGWLSHWHPYWIAPAVETGAVATGGVSYATTPATNRCNCLTKEYTQEGAVVFKDVCTNEMAMNPPANASPADDMTPQIPQRPIQQGYLQPQGQ